MTTLSLALTFVSTFFSGITIGICIAVVIYTRGGSR